jgi:hypothetical protein
MTVEEFARRHGIPLKAMITFCRRKKFDFRIRYEDCEIEETTQNLRQAIAYHRGQLTNADAPVKF